VNEGVAYYQADRTHLALAKGTPAGRHADGDAGSLSQGCGRRDLVVSVIFRCLFVRARKPGGLKPVLRSSEEIITTVKWVLELQATVRVDYFMRSRKCSRSALIVRSKGSTEP